MDTEKIPGIQPFVKYYFTPCSISVHLRASEAIRVQFLTRGSSSMPYGFGKSNGSATSDVYMHRALCPQSGTMVTTWWAPNFSFT